MVEMQIAYEGKLRCTATHEPSGTTMITDAPKDNMGEAKSFSPTDLAQNDSIFASARYPRKAAG